MLVDQLNSNRYFEVNKTKLFVLLGIIFAVIRLCATSDRDILATNSPHDEFWYINYAYYLFAEKNYDHMIMAHLPTYSYFLALGSKLGFPIRLLTDLLWVGGAFYLSKVIFSLSNKNIFISIGMFLFLIFHPYTLNYFDRALSENLLSCLTLLLVAIGIEIAFNKKITFTKILIFSVLFGISYSVRSEGIVLLAPFLTLWLAYLIFNKKNKIKDFLNSRVNKTVLFSIFSLIIFSLIISSVNYMKWGSFVKDELKSPGYSAAMKALISIDVGPTPYQTSITMDMLREGEKYSPALKDVNHYLVGATGKGWMRISEEATLIPGEIGNGWFYWALRDSAAATGWHVNPRFANEKYQQISAEINQAFENGQLKKRKYAFSSFIDPDYSKWVGFIYPTFKNLTDLLLFPNTIYLEKRMEDPSFEQMQEYTKIAGRRNLLPSLKLSGWVVGDVSQSAYFYNENLIAVEKINSSERPDVKNAHGFSFRTNTSVLPNKVCFYKNVLETSNCIGLERLTTGSILEFGNKNIIGVDSFSIDNPILRRSDRLFQLLCDIYDYLTYFLIAINLVILVLNTYKKKLEIHNFIFFGAILIFILSRLGLFSILGASSWSAMQARYLMPIIPFLTIIIFPVSWSIKKNDF